MMCLFNDGLEGKYVINGLISRLKFFLSSSSEGYFLNLTRDVHMKNHSIEFRERVAHHHRPIVDGI
jgi:hypothetical protein